MIEALNNIKTIIEWYETASIKHLEALSKAHKKLTSNLFYLETHRAKYHDSFQNIIYDLTRDNISVARAENEAHIKVPEIYMLRHIMKAGYCCADSIRTVISFGKTEFKNQNQIN